MAITRLGGANAISGVIPTTVGGTGSTASTLPASLINNTSISNITALPSAVPVGGLIPIATASGTASSIGFDNTKVTTDYVNYQIHGYNLTVATDTVELGMRFSTNNGSSFISGSVGRIYNRSSSSAASGSELTSGTTFNLNTDLGNDANLGGTVVVFLNGLTQSIFQKKFMAWCHAKHQTDDYGWTNNLIVPTNSAINYVDFVASSGTVTGTFTLYGVKGTS